MPGISRRLVRAADMKKAAHLDRRVIASSGEFECSETVPFGRQTFGLLETINQSDLSMLVKKRAF